MRSNTYSLQHLVALGCRCRPFPIIRQDDAQIQWIYVHTDVHSSACSTKQSVCSLDIHLVGRSESQPELKKRGPFAELREGDAIESVEDSDERIMSDGGNPTAMQMTRLLGRSSISSAQSEKPTNPRNAFCPALAELLVNTRQMMGR
jgi:hypothetical protein